MVIDFEKKLFLAASSELALLGGKRGGLSVGLERGGGDRREDGRRKAECQAGGIRPLQYNGLCVLPCDATSRRQWFALM